MPPLADGTRWRLSGRRVVAVLDSAGDGEMVQADAIRWSRAWEKAGSGFEGPQGNADRRKTVLTALCVDGALLSQEAQPNTPLDEGKFDMKYLSALLLSGAVVVTSASAEWRPTAREGSLAERAEIDARVARWDSPDFDISKLSVDDRKRLAAHEGAITTHPPMTYDALGILYGPIDDLPLSTFHGELATSDSSGYASAGRDLLYRFNIQLLSPWHSIEWPREATLWVDLSKNGVGSSLAVEMVLRDGDSYYMANPTLFASNLGEAIGSLGQFPRMTLVRLEGFEFSERTISDMPPLGVAVTYNVRFGDMRVDTGFQWAGRPAGIPNGGEGFLK